MFCLLSLEKAVAQKTAGTKQDHVMMITYKIVERPNGQGLEMRYDTTWKEMSPAMLAKSSALLKGASSSSCTCNCLKPLFEYLISSHRLFTPLSDHIVMSSLIQDANNAGYNVSYTECPLLSKNIDKYFYALTTAATATVYRARIGDCTVSIKSVNSTPVNFEQLAGAQCDGEKVSFGKEGVIQKTYGVTRSMAAQVQSNSAKFPGGAKTDTSVTRIFAATGDYETDHYVIFGLFAFDSLVNIPANAIIKSAKLKLYADQGGVVHPSFTTAHVPNSQYTLFLTGYPWNHNTPISQITNPLIGVPNGPFFITDPFQDLEVDIKSWFPQPYDLRHRGIQMMTVPSAPDGVYTPIHTTFYSQRDPNVAKHPAIEVAYVTEPAVGDAAELQIDTCYSCTPVPSGICYSAVTDTSVNPFMYGIAGNWRAYRSYAYYGTRAETDPAQATNIRKDGTFNDFASFWNQVSGSLKAQPDTNKWVWNSETTLFNRRGIELENKDPLGRYNAGLYGYDDALPVAVIQNSRFRESAFDGFEDYYFGNNICDTACSGSRNFDFSAYKSNLDTTQQHTGRYSLKVTAGNSAGISAKLVAVDDNVFGLSFNKAANNCPGGGDILKSVRANADVLLPTFSPLSGKKVVVSAWAKESQDCNGTSYTGNQIGIVVAQGSTSTTVIAKPTGNIIEGWQRYEQVVELPAGATMISINLQATGSADVYFDDVRIHPYNANMKSFVYNSVNLRLMSELDENNYATFYEYDDDGGLIRLKKETSRGIKTIRETRNGLLKEETP